MKKKENLKQFIIITYGFFNLFVNWDLVGVLVLRPYRVNNGKQLEDNENPPIV